MPLLLEAWNNSLTSQLKVGLCNAEFNHPVMFTQQTHLEISILAQFVDLFDLSSLWKALSNLISLPLRHEMDKHRKVWEPHSGKSLKCFLKVEWHPSQRSDLRYITLRTPHCD